MCIAICVAVYLRNVSEESVNLCLCITCVDLVKVCAATRVAVYLRVLSVESVNMCLRITCADLMRVYIAVRVAVCLLKVLSIESISLFL